MTAKLLLAILCHAACAFFAGMETGIISCSRLRLLHLSREGDRRAKVLLHALRNPDRLLGTLLVGGNIASVMVSTLCASIAYSIAGPAGLGVSSAISTLTILVFGEYLPKAWFSARPLSRSLPLAELLDFAETILSPLSLAATFLSSLLVPVKGESAGARRFVSREHLRLLASNSEAAGQISPLENLMIGRTLTLQAKTAREVMVPRDSVSILAPDATLADVSRLVAATDHGKFPVIDPASGRCLGVLHVQDVLARIAGNQEEPITEYLRKPFYVRANVRADDILPKLRDHGQRIAIVRDKASPCLGIVTIDSLLNAIVGNLPRGISGDRKPSPRFGKRSREGGAR